MYTIAWTSVRRAEELLDVLPRGFALCLSRTTEKRLCGQGLTRCGSADSVRETNMKGGVYRGRDRLTPWDHGIVQSKGSSCKCKRKYIEKTRNAIAQNSPSTACIYSASHE